VYAPVAMELPEGTEVRVFVRIVRNGADLKNKLMGFMVYF
jgi:hypothetical protein